MNKQQQQLAKTPPRRVIRWQMLALVFVLSAAMWLHRMNFYYREAERLPPASARPCSVADDQPLVQGLTSSESMMCSGQMLFGNEPVRYTPAFLAHLFVVPQLMLLQTAMAMLYNRKVARGNGPAARK
jgi:hypothetical protein